MWTVGFSQGSLTSFSYFLNHGVGIKKPWNLIVTHNRNSWIIACDISDRLCPSILTTICWFLSLNILSWTVTLTGTSRLWYWGAVVLEKQVKKYIYYILSKFEILFRSDYVKSLCKIR